MSGTILGISGVYGHDSAASLMVDGRVIAAAEEERFTHEKHTGRMPYNAIDYCLSEANLNPRDVSVVAFPFVLEDRLRGSILHSFETMPNQIDYHFQNLSGLESFKTSCARAAEIERKLIGALDDSKAYCTKHFPTASYVTFPHHKAHAASAVYPSGLDNPAVLVVDLIGEWDTTSAYVVNDGEIEKCWSLPFPHSLGKLYQTFTKFLGFRPNSDEFKVMGLASYGSEKYVDFFRSLVFSDSEGKFTISRKLLFYDGIRPEWDERITSVIGGPRLSESAINQRHADIAYGIQTVTEEILLHMTKHLRETTSRKSLVMAGGVALNALANQKIREQSGFEELFIQPASYDAGASLGALYLAARALDNEAEFSPLNDYYLGPSFDSLSILDAIRCSGNKSREASVDEIADLLAQDKIIGLFQGRMEFGPRALGNRSILASPAKAQMKDVLNDKIKYRESYRPFAPVLPEELVSEYFEEGRTSRFMTQTFTAKAITRQNAPAVVHEDGTSRIQTVSSRSNPYLHDLVTVFGQKSGIPILINTSLNLNGDTMALTPQDAIRTFEKSGMDGIILEDQLIVK